MALVDGPTGGWENYYSCEKLHSQWNDRMVSQRSTYHRSGHVSEFHLVHRRQQINSIFCCHCSASSSSSFATLLSKSLGIASG